MKCVLESQYFKIIKKIILTKLGLIYFNLQMRPKANVYVEIKRDIVSFYFQFLKPSNLIFIDIEEKRYKNH